MIPTITVHHLPWSPGQPTVLGEQSPAWGEPAPVAVFGWAPVGEDEPSQVARDAVVREVDLLVPPGVAGGPRDQWLLDDHVPWEQVGHVKDFTHGPFGFTPGGTIRLRRVEG